MSLIEDNDNENDDYEDTESIKLLSQANKILNQKELTDESFKFFIAMNSDVLMKIVSQLSKEKAEKLMNYLSKQKISKKEEKLQKTLLKNNAKSSFVQHPVSQVVQKKKEFFNPSAPVWLDEKVYGQEGQSSDNPSILNQLLREHEEEQNKKIGKDSSYLYKKNNKYRMDPSQYQFDDMAKNHDKQNVIFPFYSVVAKVMYSYGDLLKNDEKAVEMMHSQIEEMLKAVFEKKLMQKLIKYCKQNSQNLYELDDDYENDAEESSQSKEKFVFPKATKTIKRCFNQYFQTVFTEQFKVYQRFKETYQGIKEEGGFFNSNKDRKGDKQAISSSSEDSSDDDKNSDLHNGDEEEPEDHQLREMKDHFDRDDEEEDDELGDDEDGKKLKSGNKETDKRNGNKGAKREKKDLLFFDENEEDDEEEGDQNQEEMQETIDTLKQIEQIASLEEEPKRDSVEEVASSSSQTQQNKEKTSDDSQQVSSKNKHQIKHSGERLYFNDEDRIAFNKERTDEMSNEEWNYFMHVRCITLTSHGNRKGFIEFVNINKFSSQFIEAIHVFIPFLSYCICKMIGIVIEQILRSRNNGLLKQPEHPVTEREVQIFGNAVIERYIARAKRHILSREKLIRSAFQHFSSEFQVHGYDKILNQERNLALKIIKSKANKNEQKIQEEKNYVPDEQFIREQWKSMKSAYKKMWVERVISEKQIKKFIEEKTQNRDSRQALSDLLRTDSSKIQFINKYSSYLYERVLEDMQKSWHNVDYAQHFKNWFLNNDSQRTGQIKKALLNNLSTQTKDQKRKIIKFESILD